MKRTAFERKYRYAVVICTNSGVSDYNQETIFFKIILIYFQLGD